MQLRILPPTTDGLSQAVPPIRKVTKKQLKKIIDKGEQRVLTGVFEGIEFKTGPAHPFTEV